MAFTIRLIISLPDNQSIPNQWYEYHTCRITDVMYLYSIDIQCSSQFQKVIWQGVFACMLL